MKGWIVGLSLLVVGCLLILFIPKKENTPPPEWMLTQIHDDLSPYKESGISLQTLDQAAKDYLIFSPQNSFEVVRCRLHKGKVSIVDLLQKKDSYSRFKTINKALKRLKSLPEVEFLVCIGDALDPKAALFFKKYHIPVLTFAKLQKDQTSVLIPDCTALSKKFCRKMQSRTSKGHDLFPWHEKEEKAFWRGATTGGALQLNDYQELPRIKLVYLSSEHPQLIDAKLTVLGQIADPKIFELLSPFVGKSVSLVDHLKYKYQILIDGNTCAYSRAYWQLFSDCLMFKQTSPNIQWYYKALFPYVHYVPIENNLSDLKEKIEWAQSHDKEAQAIVASANDFAQNNLNKDAIDLYFQLFLQEYAKLQF